MSERPKYQSQIDERITAYPYGTAFSASDFLDIADANSVSQALFRIEKDGKIRRVINGISGRAKKEKIKWDTVGAKSLSDLILESLTAFATAINVEGERVKIAITKLAKRSRASVKINGGF